MRAFNLLKKKRIYMDNAASTETDPRVVASMKPFWNICYGNPGGIHKEARAARDAVNKAREEIACTLSVKPDEIIFVSGGTESNNLAISGAISKASENRALSDLHAITTKIEHPSVLDVFRKLESEGLNVTYLDVDEEGLLSKETLEEALRGNTILISVMYVNSEIGTVQKISELSRVTREYEKENNTRILFHTDASQAPLYLNCIPHYLGVDLLTIDGQKINGPKGVGILFKGSDVKINKILEGGSQEGGLRPGTENVPLIVGLSTAMSIAKDEQKESSKKVKEIRDHFIESLEREVWGVSINGSKKNRIANNVNISIEGIDGEFLVVYLDKEGIASSTKSACLSDNENSSYVVSSIRDTDLNPIRFTIGKDTTKKDVDYTIKTIQRFLKKFDR
ncbi:MAG: cysteine desulfurase family protein [Candidatus Pacebacteria bacterium]|jgi:cysteine desulfurase|nr:cysteine desulfurase NifS [bacterium]MDP6527834.1 cysteine desulfurase family protein [Candidatus Paceibacterota bacterium]MDP6659811.1 cysteine desulfurase family protein [Candidatus Paceibacterota bacterium]